MAIVFFMSALSLLIRLMFMPLILDYYVVQPSPRIVGLSKDSTNKTNKQTAFEHYDSVCKILLCTEEELVLYRGRLLLPL